MMAIKAQIHAATAASEDARIALEAATAHLALGDLHAVDAHLAIADAAYNRARQHVVAARRRASLRATQTQPEDDDPHYDPSCPDYDWSVAGDAAQAGVS
jgi:hypothetical protein